MIKWKQLIISIVIVAVILFIGGLFTSNSVDSQWYEDIKPDITPPNYVFGPVWTILYILIAIALYFVLIAKKGEVRSIVLSLIVINLILNVLWSYLFFTLQNPLAAFVDIVLLWFSILAIMIYGWKLDKKITYLILLYFLWVSFASLLNWLMI